MACNAKRRITQKRERESIAHVCAKSEKVILKTAVDLLVRWKCGCPERTRSGKYSLGIPDACEVETRASARAQQQAPINFRSVFEQSPRGLTQLEPIRGALHAVDITHRLRRGCEKWRMRTSLSAEAVYRRAFPWCYCCCCRGGESLCAKK